MASAGRDACQGGTQPQLGGLVGWTGHGGIVVNPAQLVFFRLLSHCPGGDAADAQYWKHRGQARFFRYVKTDPARVTPPRLVSQRHK